MTPAQLIATIKKTPEVYVVEITKEAHIGLFVDSMKSHYKVKEIQKAEDIQGSIFEESPVFYGMYSEALYNNTMSSVRSSRVVLFCTHGNMPKKKDDLNMFVALEEYKPAAVIKAMSNAIKAKFLLEEVDDKALKILTDGVYSLDYDRTLNTYYRLHLECEGKITPTYIMKDPILQMLRTDEKAELDLITCLFQGDTAATMRLLDFIFLEVHPMALVKKLTTHLKKYLLIMDAAYSIKKGGNAAIVAALAEYKISPGLVGYTLKVRGTGKDLTKALTMMYWLGEVDLMNKVQMRSNPHLTLKLGILGYISQFFESI